ncbi:CheY-like chemotaxis protein [Gillisia mitskevichiae]|uniref:CheY-like chemotaxis protein n=1 Tax=Gillisia mitskevichiae TaxID=270921 RepID=A0A495PIQ4_9FLAO|nr:response regulator [Gillisia mitskevichiae]RKS50563.1 CheY-like chemotaxis protein [Gillisia mitskevichiae]
MNPITILLIEDNEGDILLTKEALLEGDIAKEIFVVKDGWDALLYLEKKENYSTAVIPDLILLDINLPKMNGHEVLQKIKSNDRIKHIPVIMLSTSSAKHDINQCYKNQASCYITKPVDANDFTNVISSIEKFWFTTVNLPHNK